MTLSSADNHSIAPAGILLGIGLGGFVDGILFHQILQFHNMLSAKLPPNTMHRLRENMTADGLFHACTLLVTVAGLACLWRALNGTGHRRPASALVGYLLVGWGWFNLVEGLVDHQILGLHHVVERLGLSVWDWLFLASGVALMAGGHVMGRRRLANLPRTLINTDRRGVGPGTSDQ